MFSFPDLITILFIVYLNQNQNKNNCLELELLQSSKSLLSHIFLSISSFTLKIFFEETGSNL